MVFSDGTGAESRLMRNRTESLSIALGVHFVVWLIIGLVVIAFVEAESFGKGKNLWQGWQESSGLRKPSYTERIFFEDLFRTRANTWSNLAYVVVGLYCVALGWKDRWTTRDTNTGYLENTPALSLTFGVACIYLGLASGLFHASLTRFGQQLDVASMYSPLLSIIALCVGRQIEMRVPGRWRPLPIWPILVGAVAISSGLLFVYKWQMSSFTVLCSLIAVVSLLITFDRITLPTRFDERWLFVSVLTMVSAVACRELDINGRFTSPKSWMQGHACWHILTGVALACLYAHQRSERFPDHRLVEN